MIQHEGLLLVFAALSVASTIPWHKPAEVSDLQWGACSAEMNFTSAYPYQCSTLTVPLDYTDESDNRTIDLQLLRVPALKQPAKGAMLFNPGGPGGVGTIAVAGFADEIQTILGGEYDLIGFDPRGTGNTLPYACNTTEEFSKKTKRQDIPEPTLPTGELDVNPDELSLDEVLDYLQQALLDDYQELGQICATDNEEFGEMIGTAFVARDMLNIVDALNQGDLLNYWGISYGTVLGGTFAAMFPDRVGRMLLESNVNFVEYMAGIALEARTTLDDNVNALFTQCIDNPATCVLAGDNQTAGSLAQNYQNLLEALAVFPIPVSEGTIDDGAVRNFVLGQMYNPRDWPEIAEGLKALYDGEYEEFLQLALPTPDNDDDYDKGKNSLFGIRCGDSRLRVENVTEVSGLVEKLLNVSQWFPMQPVDDTLMCAGWQQDAKERYRGNFQVQTETPVLFINNVFDNITPLVSAQNNSMNLKDSVLLVQNSYGHVPEYSPSLCTVQAIRTYFSNGTLPQPNTVCEQEVPNFVAQNSLQILHAWNATTSQYTTEEVKLLQACQSLGEKVARARH